MALTCGNLYAESCLRRTVELLAAVLVSSAIAFQVGSCGTQTVTRERDTARDLAFRYQAQRDSLTVVRRATDTVITRVVVQDRKLLAQRDSLATVLAYAERVLRDSTATLAETRGALRLTIERSAEFQATALAYRDSVAVLIDVFHVERSAANTALIAADSAVNGFKRVADAERRNGWRRFVQGALVGGVVTLLAVVAL